MIAGFYVPKTQKIEYNKSKSIPPKIILDPLNWGNSTILRKKRTGQQSFSPSLDMSRITEDEGMPSSQIWKILLLFPLLPRFWWMIKKLASTKPPY